MLNYDLINMLSNFGADFSRLHGFDIKDLILGEYSMSAESVINMLQYAGANFGAIEPWDLVKLITSFSGHHHPEAMHMHHHDMHMHYHNMNMSKCTDVIEHLSYTNAKFELSNSMVAKLIDKCGINVVESLESVGV